MKTPFASRRAAMSGLAAVVLALSAGAAAPVPAAATENCTVVCPGDDRKSPALGGSKPQQQPAEPQPEATEPVPPVEQAPAPAPLTSRPPAPASVPAPAAPPAGVIEEVMPTAETAVVVPVPPSPAPVASTQTPQPSTESNWNKPIRRQAEPSSEAASVAFKGPGSGFAGVAAIMGGVFLVGVAGLAFAWWARSRFSHH